MASATAVTAVGAVVGVASGSEGQTTQTVDVAGSTLLADIPSGAQAQTISDNISRQADAQQYAADAAAKKAEQEAARIKAAEVARAKADADRKAKEAEARRKQQQEAASRAASRSVLSAPTVDVSPGSVQALAQSIIGNSAQFQCFSNIVERESGWNVTATNPSSGAYGLVQALPGSKMASAGADWRTNPATQIKWGLSYMNGRYGSPCDAWSYWQVHHSY